MTGTPKAHASFFRFFIIQVGTDLRYVGPIQRPGVQVDDVGCVTDYVRHQQMG